MLLLSAAAHASILSASPVNGVTPEVPPGESFSLWITSQTPPTTGLAYVMLASRGDIFTLIGRDVTGSPFTVLDVPNNDTDSQLGVLGATADLVPANGSDLGADTVGDLSVTGTQHVATLTFRVNDDAPPGVYTLQPWDDLIDGGWYGPGPAFERSIFDDFDDAIVIVKTPEPPVWMALIVGGLLWRRHKNVVHPNPSVNVESHTIAGREWRGSDRDGVPRTMVRRKGKRLSAQSFPAVTVPVHEVVHGLASYRAGGIHA